GSLAPHDPREAAIAVTRARMIAATAVAIAILSIACAWGAEATFPGRNGDIVFGRGGDIWAVSAKGKATTRLTNSPHAREGLPDWNAAGLQVAFTRCRGGEFG